MTSLVSVDKIEPNEWNPNVMGEVEYAALKQDMHVHGVNGVDAILVSPKGKFLDAPHEELEGFYVIVDGEHRWRAAKELGWKEVLCEVREISEDDAKALCYRRNRERGNIDPFKEALLFKTELPKLNQAKIAGKYGVDQSTVSHRLSLLKLDSDVVKAVKDLPRGIITPSHLEPIASLAPADQKLVLKEELVTPLKSRDSMPSVRWVQSRVARIKEVRAEEMALAKALEIAKYPKCPQCHEKPSDISHQGLPWVRCRNWHTAWNLETGKREYEPEVSRQKNLAGETEERVSRTLRCSHTVKELHGIFAERLKELIPKLDKISTLKVSGILEGAEFSVDLTGYSHIMAISTHHGRTWLGFRAEDHEYKTGEKSAVQVNDPKEIELARQLIDNAFQGKLGIPVEKIVAKKRKGAKKSVEEQVHELHADDEEEPLEAENIATTDDPANSLSSEEAP